LSTGKTKGLNNLAILNYLRSLLATIMRRFHVATSGLISSLSQILSGERGFLLEKKKGYLQKNMLCAAAISDILIAGAPPDIKSCAFNSFRNAFEDAVEVAKYLLKLPDSKLNIDMSTFYEKT
jgi:hypothetical protein